jgi:hypothetical protein
MPKAVSKEKALAKRVSAIEQKVDALSRETPMPPEQRASAQAAGAREADVAQTLARFGGRSTSGTMPDAERGPVSSLGHGTGSQPMRKGKRR